MNTGALWPTLDEAEAQVLGMQRKLHQWAAADPGRRFDDLYNLVCDPAFLVVAWSRVRGNRGARTAGVDGLRPRDVVFGDSLLAGLRGALKARQFSPVLVRQKAIPKGGGKVRRLGIPTAADRVVQASLKLVLEPIFETDFHPCSYGFRPKRRAQDAIAEIHYLASPPRNYEWVFETDIEACFDNIDHTALMGGVRRRVGDKRVLGLVKAFLRAGVLTEDGVRRDTITGTPQGGILSPLLANVALSTLDEHFAAKWEALGSKSTRSKRRRSGTPVFRLVRIEGGMQPVAEALAALLRHGTVCLGHAVSDIKQSDDGVTVVATTSAETTFAAARVVVALPPTLAGRIRYEPPLPAQRDQLVQHMPQGSVIKFHALYDDPWWRDDGLSGFVLAPNEPIGVTFDCTPPAGAPGLITGFFEGPSAVAAGLTTTEARQEVAVDVLVRALGDRARNVLAYLDRDWSAEPFTRGCYGAHLPPGAWTVYGPVLRPPVGLIHWAGTETAEHWTGYVEGAIDSGLRVAAEILSVHGVRS